MGFFDRFRRAPRSTRSADLLGCWQLVRSEPEADGKGVEMEFRPDGELQYRIDAGDRWQIMRLTYRVEGDVIVTDQPSAPREERTRFTLLDDGSLLLKLRGSRTWYRRGERRAPAV
jgi:hypothetical protein